MAFLSFNWDKHFIYAIVYWILEILIRLGMYIQWNVYKMSDSEVQNEYIYVVLLNIADLLSCFLVLYIKCSFRRQSKIKKANAEVALIYDNYEANKKKKLIKRLIIICVLDYLSRSLYWISYAITGAKNGNVSHQLQKDIVNTLDILMRYIFSIFILHIIIHKHRIVSMVSIFVGFVILLPADFILLHRDEEKSMGKSVVYVAILALRGIFIPFEDTIIKKLYTDNYVLPENFMLYRGVLECLIIIVVTPVLYFSFGVKWDIYFSRENIITIIIYTLCAFVKSYFLLKIIYHFSSQSVSFLVISESVTGSILQIINFINDTKKDPEDIILVIVEIIGIIILAFSTLLYDEIIIIKKWGLEVNVRKEISNRGKEDFTKTIELELNRETTLEEDTQKDDDDNHDNDIKENLRNSPLDNEVEENEKSTK